MATNLTFKFVENLKAPGRYTDALVKGLHLWVKVNLKQYWIFRFSSNGKQHNISLGADPKVTCVWIYQIRPNSLLPLSKPWKTRQDLQKLLIV